MSQRRYTKRIVEFTTERYSCINAKCWAVVKIFDDDGSLFDVLEWGDEYAAFDECPQRVYDAIDEACRDLAPGDIV